MPLSDGFDFAIFPKMIVKFVKPGAMILLVVFGLSLLLSLAMAWTNGASGKNFHWSTAPRHSSGVAPDPLQNAAVAVVQVYAAPTYGWRGLFAVHPWIICKRQGKTAFVRYEVIGWGGSNVVKRNSALPDGLWFGARPHLLADHRGEGVEAMIDAVEAAVRSYPFADQYRSYPGPNSNTFMAHIGREVPALKLDLPANAIGKDYRPLSRPFGLSPTGRGLQASLLGLLGVSVGLEEGIEANFLGLNFGIDLNTPGLRLPFVGRLGMDDVSLSWSANRR